MSENILDYKVFIPTVLIGAEIFLYYSTITTTQCFTVFINSRIHSYIHTYIYIHTHTHIDTYIPVNLTIKTNKVLLTPFYDPRFIFASNLNLEKKQKTSEMKNQILSMHFYKSYSCPNRTFNNNKRISCI